MVHLADFITARKKVTPQGDTDAVFKIDTWTSIPVAYLILNELIIFTVVSSKLRSRVIAFQSCSRFDTIWPAARSAFRPFSIGPSTIHWKTGSFMEFVLLS